MISSTKRHTGVVFFKQRVSALQHWVAGRRYEARQNLLVGQILSSRPLLHAAAVSAIGCNREQRPIAEVPFVYAIGDLVEWPSYLHMSSYGYA